SFTRTLSNALQPGASWSYRLIGGADLASADVLATRSDASGDVRLAPGALVRTGSGDISLAAGGDLLLGDDRAAIYTAGRQLPLNADHASDNAYGSLTRLLERFYAEFPVEGGDIRIRTGGDIIGATQSTSTYTIVTGRQITATTHQFISDWLTRTGSGLEYVGWGLALDLPSQVATATSGGVPIRNLLNARAGFRQNIGTLGGGDVDIDAGGDITDLSVMLPTTGKPVGQRSTPELPTSSGFDSNAILVQGGGDLRLRAAGDIRGGMVMVARGSANLSAGGDVRGGTQYRDGPVFALGDASLAVTAGASLALGAVFDPTMVTQVFALNPASAASYGLSYTARSEVSVTALGGVLQLINDTDQLALQGIRYVAR
ncbi:unnamed protein product, partial [Phaeothamnion confervicola]